jgi:hypothetical protein
MEFAVSFRGDHIQVELNAETNISDPDLPKDYWQTLRKLSEEYNCRRILVEGSAPATDLGAAEVIEAGERTAAIPNLWLAFHLENHVANEQSELYEAVAAAKGVRVKFFDTADAALKWLRANG